MAEKKQSDTLDLNEDEKNIIAKSVDSIRNVLRTKNRDIKSIIGLVTKSDVQATKAAVEVRFAEENVLNVQMNMVAFD
jgi:hypothetical protein